MTIDIQEASRIYQAGIEVGRTMAKHEMDEFLKVTKATAPTTITVNVPSSGSLVTGKGLHAGTKIARGVAKAPMTRTKGVKEAIIKVITEHNANGITTGEIIAATGQKKTSVRATLMSMKKAGKAIQDGPNWFLPRGFFSPVADGNSEAMVRSEY